MESAAITTFDNNYILSRIEENRRSKERQIISKIKSAHPSLTDEQCLDIYHMSISIHQSNIQGNGSFLENDILVGELQKHAIPYRQQVTINDEGIIVGFNEKKKRCYHVLDFVVGEDIAVGKPITEFQVISCKTTCRERWTQDDWSFTFVPALYILLTISDDYPSTTRFREDERRKIISCIPKKKDDRKYKLNFEHLIGELCCQR